MRKNILLTTVHEWVGAILKPGDVAIDATVGNGHDTVFLARSVGEMGRVYGFDIQASALETTRERLESEGLTKQVSLFQQGHEHLREVTPSQEPGSVKVFMFNLGYLPGHDTKEVITQAETTLRALAQALDLLSPGGLITLVLYTGHPGGAEEALAVTDWVSVLDQREYTVERHDTISQQNNPPFALGIRKTS